MARSLVALTLIAPFFAFSAMAVDGTATVTGGEVQYYGVDEVTWLNGTELLLKFTGEGSFILPGKTKARILAVGGGGGGGGVCTASAAMTTYFGAGGGGGAGGFVEVTNVFSAETYAVAVGSGGAGGASATTHTSLRGRYTGTSGGSTTVSMGGSALITAVGGGAGGGEGDGLAGGSGGGGSAYRSGSAAKENHPGGSATDGQGFVGGAGDIGLYAGGGGGAGGAGAAASTTNPVGGDGRASDITCNDGEEPVWYAGGGGGGFSDKSFTGLHDPIAGGKGGGGRGGYGLNVACTDASFYGGGGGGCGALAASSTTRGGSGYQGVVYVRIIVVTTEEIVKPTDLAVDFDGVEHVLVAANPAYVITDMTEGSATYGQVVERMAGTASGTYKASVKLVDGFKWPDNTDDEVTVTLTISKATPVISNLAIRNWIFGTPDEATPNPGCDVSIAVTPEYSYGESETGPWVAEKPTEVGTHYLRAYIEATDSYNGAEAVTSFEILNGPGDVYRDYVEITIAGASAATDFAYTLKLAEGAPVGFLYSRAGSTGEDLAVTDADGNILDYRVDYWNTSGESTIWVRLPTLSTSEQVIRLFWYVRDGKTPPSHSSLVDEPSGAQPTHDFDLVVRDGKRVNYWLTYPSLTKTKWDSEDATPGAVASAGTIAEGTSELLYVTNLNTGAVSGGIPTAGGSYSAVFGPHDPGSVYEKLNYGVDFFVVGHVTYDDLSGDAGGLTQNGRVLLANDDSAPGGHVITDQSYWQTDSTKYSTYWVHSENHAANAVTYPYLRQCANHVLYHVDGATTNVLWTLDDVIIGNNYGTGGSMEPTYCYLPNSPTAKAISSETASPGLTEQGNMVMRNKEGAVILSPIYTNGVGTIYFDVVNADREYSASGGYKIKVEVSLDGGTNYTAYAMRPLKRDGTSYFVADQTDTNELKLEMANYGTADNFYRVAVPVDNGGNVRFRIVRTGWVSAWIPDSAFILVDNIIVSYPKATASLEPYGDFDKNRKGRQVVGWGGAMAEPFPEIGAEGVYARAKAVVETNANAHVAVDMPITWAQMHYRWRYLTQRTNDWQVINLRPTADFTSTQPLDIPAAEGDIEFWYDYIVQVPAYKYYDYSGLGLGLAGPDGKALYSEEVTESTNRLDITSLGLAANGRLASAGTDWFFRLRRGRSEWEGFKIYAKESEDGDVREYDMTLVGSHMWRGFVPTRNVLEGGLYVRVAGINSQMSGDREYDLNKQRYSLPANATVLPATGVMSTSDSDDTWAWRTIPCDAKTGHVLLQLQDDTLACTVVHADYQDFNGWTDAYKTDGNGLFVGTSSDTNSTHMSGTTSEAVTHATHFENWNLTVPTNKYWVETFPATKAELDTGAWPLYDPFESSVSPNTAFTVGPGQWVNAWYRWNGSTTYNPGMALQMEGKGKGYIQLVDFAQSPRGLESVTFKARVAQAIEFNDFCYCMTDPTALTTYTFATAAAFDVNSRKDFAGNASLSLVAFYMPGVGCYELRVEQEDASVNSAGVVSPGNTFRLSLYRWRYDDESGEVVATQLGTATHSNGSNMFATSSDGGNYARLFISVDTSVAGETRVVGGVARTSVARASFFNSLSYREVMYRDRDEARLTYGTYGLLSANCPARFLQPSYSASAATYQASSTQLGFQQGSYTVVPLPGTRVECRADIVAGRWKITKSRMVAVNMDNANNYSINAVIPSTTVDVYTAPAGTVNWKLLKSQEVSGFGSSSSAGEATTVNLYSLDPCSVRIQAGGSYKTARVDVTVDDIEFRQWRGESYDEANQTGVFDSLEYGSPTNIVFTQGWISTPDGSSAEKTCLLSAKRSLSGVATSIRSPRMVSDTDKGLGLGMVSFTYADAQSNAVVLVQVATNNVALSSFAAMSKSTSEGYWTTVTNIDFSAMTETERLSGVVRCYIGLHGVRGAMRIALDPATVAAVAGITDPTAFGEVAITGVSFRDEPMLGAYSWWGWNLRTTGEDDKISLVDNANDPLENGLSFGLNNAVDADIRNDESVDQYKKRYPLLQTPTFATNMVNEVSFMARLYDPTSGTARVTLYGAASGDLSDEASWTKLTSWDITNVTYAAYSKKFAAGNTYKAFRLAVTGVDGVTEPMTDADPLVPAQRVLIDEVLVMEGIVATVSFRNVGAFRSGLDATTAATNVPSASQQPLVGEEWGVQCEVYASQLADEIDLSSARVRLWWYESASPWGFDNWKDRSGAKNAWLAEASDSNLVFRSGYFGASAAVMPAQRSATTVQYMLEVVYRANGVPQTNWLSQASTEDAGWVNPSWYRPIDYNADYGKGSFSAYTILDTVAPGWAWINEVNIFGERDDNWQNSDKMLQFVEIAAPAEANLSGWTLRFLEAKMSGSPVRLASVITNDVASFGMNGLPGKKSGLVGMDVDSKMVFHVIGSPLAGGVLDSTDGRLDGTWTVESPRDMVTSRGEVMDYFPFAVQLVRPSGVIESEIVAIGTNDWSYVSTYNPEYAAELLSGQERGGSFVNVGMDSDGIPAGNAWSRSLGVFAGTGSSAMQWNAVNLMSPGRINEGQTIDGQPPEARGSALLVYSIIQGGNLVQTFGDAADTNETVTLVFRKGSEEGTNITYRAAKWHEIGTVTVNGKAVAPTPTGNTREWTLNVAKAESNDVTVIASAQVDSSLAEKYGVDPTSRYRDAIVGWLMRGADAYGNAWHNPDATTLGLADFATRAGNVETNMTLTEMYWFDIDPTWNDHDIMLKAGWVGVPQPTGSSDGVHDCRIFMQISNTVDSSAWAPYVLQGADFLNNSWEYAKTESNWQWTNETFKVMGLLPVNGLSEDINEQRNWIPLRWFVFAPDSFDANFTSRMQFADPFSMESPAGRAGWYDWKEEHGSATPNPFFKWGVDERGWPQEAEVLKTTNPWPLY